MYREIIVPVPKIKGKITIKPKKDVKYVLFEKDRVYNKEKKYNVPVRVIVGKLVPGDESRMQVNDTYLKLFPTAPQPVQVEAKRSCCIKAGSHLAVDAVVKHYELEKKTQQIFGRDAGLLLDLCAYSIVEEDNAAQYYPDYAYGHALFTENMRIYGDTKVSKFFSSMTPDQISDFLENWNKNQDHRQRIYISYDSTNKNTQAGDVDFAEFGKAKDGKGVPIFNISVAYDKTNRVPLFYEEYPGSINDVSQLTHMVDKAKGFRYRTLGFILDRGYFSRKNIEYIDENGFQFIIMVKGCKSLVSDVIAKNRNSFETDRNCALPGHHIYAKTVQLTLFSEDKRKRYFHLYFSADKMARERAQFEENLEKTARVLKTYEGQCAEFGRDITAYFDCHYEEIGKGKDTKKKFLFAEERKDAVQRRLELCGYFCIVSSEKMSAEEAYKLYKGRDVSEKLFRADKSYLGAQSMRVYSDESVNAKLFVEFVALIIRNRIYNLLKDEMARLNKKKNFMTVPAAIKELEKIELIRLGDGRYCLDHALTKNQQMILQSFGISQEEAVKRLNRLAEKLSANENNVECNESGEGDDDAQE